MENKEYTFQDAISEVCKIHGVGNWTFYQAAELYKTKATEDLKETIKDLKIANLQRDSESSTTIFVLKKDNEKLTNIISEALSLSEKANKEIERLTQSNKELRSPLSELLAVMHGDGGHYEQEHGTVKAIKDAMELLHEKWVIKHDIL